MIVALNRRGEGVTADGRAFPGALPGDVPGESPRAPRAAPPCRYFGVCGGCAAQHMPAALYADWKRDAVVAALGLAGVPAEVGPLTDAQGAGRRRATFHASVDGKVGFMRARAHEIVEIDACPLFVPELQPAITAARALTEAVRALAKPLDIQATATLTGLDVDLRGPGPLGPVETRKLIAAAERFDLARLSLHGVALIERRPPLIAFGATTIAPPPGGFLQATAAGEAALALCASAALKDARRVADLFCGAGAFALRLASEHAVFAVDNDVAALAALRRAGGVEASQRDLFRQPLAAAEIAKFDAVLFDPPRAGAERQAREIAASGVKRVVAIACNAETFARDARILIDGGYVCDGVTPIDQFRYSAHVEIFAAFRRKAKRRRGVLG